MIFDKRIDIAWEFLVLSTCFCLLYVSPQQFTEYVWVDVAIVHHNTASCKTTLHAFLHFFHQREQETVPVGISISTPCGPSHKLIAHK